jgi:hypothetical protein
MKKLILIFSLLLLVVPGLARADGGIFPPPDYWMQETDQKAVIFYEKDVETLVISIIFRGNAKDFSWIVPTPSRPEVEKSTDEIFTALEKLTQPEINYRPMPMYSGALEEAPATKGVEVIETKKVEYYDITVLEADDPEALAKWLNENKYQFPTEAKYLLDDYINNKWYFTAVKIDTKSLSEGVETQLREGHAVPLKFTFTSSKIVYPLKISGIAAYLESSNQSSAPLTEEQGAGSESGAVNTVVSANCATAKDCGGIFCPQVVGQDTPCCIGGQCVCGPSDCSEGVNPASAEVYPAPSQPSSVALLLYVFADHKKDLPGFNADYANWVKSEDVEKLAIESNGEPWIKTTAKKYYLTKLTRYMQPSEMTYDLYPRDANDNEKIGVPQTTWQSILVGILVFLVMLSIFLVVGIFSPLGLLFAVCALLQFFVKHKVVRIIAWIFQGLVLLVTFALGALIFLGWSVYGINYWLGTVYDASIALAVLVAWLIFVAAMIWIVVWQILRQIKKKK